MTLPDFQKVMYLRIQTLTNFPYIEDDFDSLTTYGFISKIVKSLNDVIHNNNLQNDTIKELYDNFLLLKEYVETYLTDLNEIKEAIFLINESIKGLQEEIERIDLDIGNLRVELTDLINDNFNILKTYIDYNVGVLDDKITHIEIGQIEVYNPTNGLLQPLQDVINSLYDASNKDGLTASEFDALDLTATGFDAYQITAYEFDSAGKTILV